MRFVLVNSTDVVDLEKITFAKFTPAGTVGPEPSLSIWDDGEQTRFEGTSAQVLWDQITRESQVAEPSPMFEAIRNLVNHAQAACDKLDEVGAKTLPFAMAIDAVRKQFKL